MGAPHDVFSPFPDRAGVRRLDDSLFARAYDALDGAARASLKLCIARLHSIYGERPPFEARTRHFAEGFGLDEDQAPADWALAVCPSDCASPAALLAVAMPAFFAGVGEVFVCFTPPSSFASGPEAIAPPLLAALELAGFEDAFFSHLADIESWLVLPGHAPGKGRLVCLGGAREHAPLVTAALCSGIPAMLLPAPPRYWSARCGAVMEQVFAVPVNADGEQPGVNAGESAASVTLDRGHESVWIWPELSPGWFRRTRMKLYDLPETRG